MAWMSVKNLHVFIDHEVLYSSMKFVNFLGCRSACFCNSLGGRIDIVFGAKHAVEVWDATELSFAVRSIFFSFAPFLWISMIDNWWWNAQITVFLPVRLARCVSLLARSDFFAFERSATDTFLGLDCAQWNRLLFLKEAVLIGIFGSWETCYMDWEKHISGYAL